MAIETIKRRTNQIKISFTANSLHGIVRSINLTDRKGLTMFNEFKKFILRGNVVDLAVGIAIGAAFNSVVNTLVTGMITPLVSAIYGNKSFASASFELNGSKFLYGEVINAIISFLIVAAVVFFLVVQPINKLSEIAMRSKDTAEPTTRKCPECLSVIPVKAKRCSFCTSVVKPEKE